MIQPIEIAPGVLLPPGNYTGRMKEDALEMPSGDQWLSPQFRLELTADKLARMGVKGPEGTLSVDYDVSSLVRSGRIQAK